MVQYITDIFCIKYLKEDLDRIKMIGLWDGTATPCTCIYTVCTPLLYDLYIHYIRQYQILYRYVLQYNVDSFSLFKKCLPSDLTFCLTAPPGKVVQRST